MPRKSKKQIGRRSKGGKQGSVPPTSEPRPSTSAALSSDDGEFSDSVGSSSSHLSAAESRVRTPRSRGVTGTVKPDSTIKMTTPQKGRRKKIERRRKVEKKSVATPTSKPRPSTSGVLSSDDDSVGVSPLLATAEKSPVGTVCTNVAAASIMDINDGSESSSSSSSSSRSARPSRRHLFQKTTEDNVPISLPPTDRTSKRRHILTPQVSEESLDDQPSTSRVPAKRPTISEPIPSTSRATLSPTAQDPLFVQPPPPPAPRRRNRRVPVPAKNPYGLRSQSADSDDAIPNSQPHPTQISGVQEDEELYGLDDNRQLEDFMANINIEDILQQEENRRQPERNVDVVRRRGRGYLDATRPCVQVHTMGALDQVCNAPQCGALYFAAEANYRGRYTKCCCNGKVVLPPLHPYPEQFQELFTRRHFMEHIRAYNNAFAFASLGANVVTPPGHGPYCFKVQGEVRHNLGHLAANIPAEQRRYGNLYFIDTAEANRQRINVGPVQLDPDIIQIIGDYLQDHNQFVEGYRFLSEVYQEQEEERRRRRQAGEAEPVYRLYFDNQRIPGRQEGEEETPPQPPTESVNEAPPTEAQEPQQPSDEKPSETTTETTDQQPAENQPPPSEGVATETPPDAPPVVEGETPPAPAVTGEGEAPPAPPAEGETPAATTAAADGETPAAAAPIEGQEGDAAAPAAPPSSEEKPAEGTATEPAATPAVAADSVPAATEAAPAGDTTAPPVVETAPAPVESTTTEAAAAPPPPPTAEAAPTTEAPPSEPAATPVEAAA